MHKKTVLITGSSRGIGKAIAMKYAKKGYNIVINCKTNEELLLKVKKEIESFQTNCLAFVGAVGDYETCELLFEQIKKHFGSIDVLINSSYK